MSAIALCQAIYWTRGVSAADKLIGIGRQLGFERLGTEEAEPVVQAETMAKPAANRKESAGTGSPRPHSNGAASNGGERWRASRKGSRRGQIVALVNASPLGLTRGEILDALGLKSDKAAEMSVSNALTAITKQNQLRHEGKKYLSVETVQQGTMEQQQAAAA